MRNKYQTKSKREGDESSGLEESRNCSFSCLEELYRFGVRLKMAFIDLAHYKAKRLSPTSFIAGSMTTF